MLQVNMQPYASDALEDAMRLAQTKALNSYSFSDCLNYLNYAWMDIYQRIAQMDEGYYSITVPIKRRLTRLPPYVKNSIRVYSAQSPIGYNRDIFRSSGNNDLTGRSTYHISGFDLYVPDAEYRNVWLNYIPQQQQIFFTRNNRDPKLYETYTPVRNDLYSLHRLCIYDVNGVRLDLAGTDLSIVGYITMEHRNTTLNMEPLDITPIILQQGPDWKLVYISCDFPYVFVTYRHAITGEYYSGFFKGILADSVFIEYNPFAYTGRNSNVEYIDCKWNDKTGLGVVIIDHNDKNRIKELGWTPDTLLIYPSPEAYRFLVARLADKFSALNESSVMGVQKELVEAQYAFDNFLKKDKSAWVRIDNVNGPTVSDLL
jgi:hypothetical protein